MDKIEKALAEATKERQPSSKANKQRYDVTEISAGSGKKVRLDRELLIKRGVMLGPCGTAVTDSYKLLRTQVERRLGQGEANTLMITSPEHGEGRTLTAVNMAICSAQVVEKRVLLVEADLRNPRMKSLLGLDTNAPGVVDYILDGKPIQDLLIHPGVYHLALLPAGRNATNSAEILGSQRMKDLIAELKYGGDFDIIVFDAPPILVAADALVLSELVDAIMMVVEAEVTPTERVAKAREMLEGKNLIGLVLNKAK